MTIGTPLSLGTGSASGAGATTINITTANNIAAGDLVFCGFHAGGASLPSLSSVSVGSNTLARAVNVTSGATVVELWYVANAAAVAAGQTMTVTFSALVGGGPAAEACAGTVSGIATSLPLDKTASQATITTSPSVSSGTLSQASEIAIGFAVQNSTYTESAGFANLNNVTQSGDVAELSYQVVASTASVTYAPTWSGSALAETLLATFKGTATVAGFLFDLCNPLR